MTNQPQSSVILESEISSCFEFKPPEAYFISNLFPLIIAPIPLNEFDI